MVSTPLPPGPTLPVPVPNKPPLFWESGYVKAWAHASQLTFRHWAVDVDF